MWGQRYTSRWRSWIVSRQSGCWVPESLGFESSLPWRHNEHDGVSNHQPHDCLLNRSGADQRKFQSFASLAFVGGIHRWPVKSPHKGQWRGKCFHLMSSSCWPCQRKTKLPPLTCLILCPSGPPKLKNKYICICIGWWMNMYFCICISSYRPLYWYNIWLWVIKSKHKSMNTLAKICSRYYQMPFLKWKPYISFWFTF